jgi:hypothetical protein
MGFQDVKKRVVIFQPHSHERGHVSRREKSGAREKNKTSRRPQYETT